MASRTASQDGSKPCQEVQVHDCRAAEALSSTARVYFVPVRAARHKLPSRGAHGGENAMLKRRAVDGDGETCLAESASLGGGSLSERCALNQAWTRRPESEGI